MKTEVYSWRLSGDVKSELEQEARLRGLPVSSVLDMAVRDWLKQSKTDAEGDEVQQRLHAAAAACFGILTGAARSSETVREAVRERLRRKHARQRAY